MIHPVISLQFEECAAIGLLPLLPDPLYSENLELEMLVLKNSVAEILISEILGILILKTFFSENLVLEMV